MTTAVSFFFLLAYSAAALGKNIEIKVDFEDAMTLLDRPKRVRPIFYPPANDIPPYAQAMMRNFQQSRPIDPYGYLQNAPDIVRQLEMNEKQPDIQLANELKDISNSLAASKNVSVLEREYANGLEDLRQKGFDLHLLNREPNIMDNIQLNKKPTSSHDMRFSTEPIHPEDDLAYTSLEKALPVQEKNLQEKIKKIIRGKRLRKRSDLQLSIEKLKTINHDPKEPNNTVQIAIAN